MSVRAFAVCAACGCGYPSYYPIPQGRDGAASWCSDPAGSASGEQVALSVANTVPVQLVRYDDACLPIDQVVLDIAGQGFSEWVPPGTVYAVENLQGGVYGVILVPFDTGGTWSVVVP